jgi:transposase
MMGEKQVEQEALFYGFSLERHVPDDHLVRSLDRFVDLSGIRAQLKSFYSTTGRPSIDPELLIRMLIIGYTHGIRSERRLCEEVHLNLAYRWFCRLGLEGDVPDHSTFSKNRHGRFRDSDLLRHLFEDVVRRCIEEGLVGGVGFAVDASIIKADANRQRSVRSEDGLPPDHSTRAVDEYLATLDDAAFGGSTEVIPKFISLADPAARWTGANRGPAFFAYCTNYLIDVKHAVIMDVEPTATIRQAETWAQRTMIDRVIDTYGVYPEKLAGDMGYGSANNLHWLVEERGIEPHIPVFSKAARTDGTFNQLEFTYDHAGDAFTCPEGKLLTTRGEPNADHFITYRATAYDCKVCPSKARCCPKEPARKLKRHIYEGARDLARDIAKTDAYLVSRRERKKVEMSFAHLKRILKLDRLRLRGPQGAKDEFLLAATAQNLRKLAKMIPMSQPVMAA